ncbi:hypothetical protein I317_03388 [Kwoniella heveanensis CBS 569]|nr:hypothetical protein I317_03388 [Kwoniella heveanensis CBS 569]
MSPCHESLTAVTPVPSNEALMTVTTAAQAEDNDTSPDYSGIIPRSPFTSALSWPSIDLDTFEIVDDNATIVAGASGSPAPVHQYQEPQVTMKGLLDNFESQITQAIDSITSATNANGYGTRPDPQHVRLFDQVQSNFSIANSHLQLLTAFESHQTQGQRQFSTDNDTGLPYHHPYTFATAWCKLGTEWGRFRESVTPYLRHYTPFIEAQLSSWRDATDRFDQRASKLLSSLLINESEQERSENAQAYYEAFQECKALGLKVGETVGSMAGMARQVASNEPGRPIHSLQNDLTVWRGTVSKTKSKLATATSQRELIQSSRNNASNPNSNANTSLLGTDEYSCQNWTSPAIARQSQALGRRFAHDQRSMATWIATYRSEARTPTTTTNDLSPLNAASALSPVTVSVLERGLGSGPRIQVPDLTGAQIDLIRYASERIGWYDDEFRAQKDEYTQVLDIWSDIPQSQALLAERQMDVMRYAEDVHSRGTRLRDMWNRGTAQ